MPKTIPARDQVDSKYTWNAESVFASTADWENEVQKILADIPVHSGYNFGFSFILRIIEEAEFRSACPVMLYRLDIHTYIINRVTILSGYIFNN